MQKTLVGKNGYLFLKNDACRELDVHCNNVCNIKSDSVKDLYNKHIDKLLITIFPNKSYVYSIYLPDDYKALYRPAFDIYSRILGNHLLDGYTVLNQIPDIFYKTDTHINFKGGYIIYKEWVIKANTLFSLNIPIRKDNIEYKEVSGLSNLNIGIGDLTWDMNRGSQVIENISDLYFYSTSVRSIYLEHKLSYYSDIRLVTYNNIDVTDKYKTQIIDWKMLSDNILHTFNDAGINKKVLFFYDSFLISTISLYMDIFKETYMAKSIYDPSLIKLLEPDLIFEFRVERFLL